MPIPAEPLLFGKFPNTLVGPGEPIVLPPTSEHVDGEAELAVVIGASAHNVDCVGAMDYVFGFTVANDVSARDLQFGDGQGFRGKGFDTFCPVLPQIVPRGDVADPHDLRVIQRVNATVMQDRSTRDLIFDIPTLVAFASAVMTLEPGNLILAGTRVLATSATRSSPCDAATALRSRSRASASSRTRWSDDRDCRGAGDGRGR